MARPTDWVDTVLSLQATTAGSTNVSLITGLAPADMRGATLIRTLIRMTLSSITPIESTGVQMLHMGIGITDQEAFAAGVLPDPGASSDKPARGWVWRDAMGVSQSALGGPSTFDVRGDIRGARKIENGELYLICDNQPVSGTGFTTLIRGLVRILIKLS